MSAQIVRAALVHCDTHAAGCIGFGLFMLRGAIQATAAAVAAGWRAECEPGECVMRHQCPRCAARAGKRGAA